MWIGTMVFYLDGGFEEVIELIILYHKTVTSGKVFKMAIKYIYCCII